MSGVSLLTYADRLAGDLPGLDRLLSNELSVFTGAHVLYFDDPDRDRVWPDGWTVRSDPTDPSRGTLVSAKHAEEPEPAVPPVRPDR